MIVRSGFLVAYLVAVLIFATSAVAWCQGGQEGPLSPFQRQGSPVTEQELEAQQAALQEQARR